MFKPFVQKKSLTILSGLLSLIIGMPSVAQAGFEWTPPAPSASQDTPEKPVTSGPLTPEMDPHLPAPVEAVEQTVVPAVAPATETVVSAPTPSESTPAEAVTPEKIVEGFGKDIPLAIALRDIAPVEYAYIFSPQDVAGLRISWRGGKPWKEVLQLALAPYNLGVSVNGNHILISGKETSSVLPSDSAPIQTANQISPEAVSPIPLVEDSPPVAAPPVTASPDPSPAPLPVVNLQMNKRWEARPGSTLRDTLESWSKSAKIEVSWSTPYDYPINNAFYFDGSFTDAVESLLSSYGGESPSPKGRLYPNLPDGPSVLMIN